MLSFVIGVAAGAGAMWLYYRAKAELEIDDIGGPMGGVQRPTESEVHGRPSAPLPEREPEPDAEHRMRSARGR